MRLSTLLRHGCRKWLATCNESEAPRGHPQQFCIFICGITWFRVNVPKAVKDAQTWNYSTLPSAQSFPPTHPLKYWWWACFASECDRQSSSFLVAQHTFFSWSQHATGATFAFQLLKVGRRERPPNFAFACFVFAAGLRSGRAGAQSGW